MSTPCFRSEFVTQPSHPNRASLVCVAFASDQPLRIKAADEVSDQCFVSSERVDHISRGWLETGVDPGDEFPAEKNRFNVGGSWLGDCWPLCELT